MNTNTHTHKIWYALGLLLLVLTLFQPLAVSAEENTTINTSNDATQNLRITFDGSTILFEDFPDEEEFNYVMLSLYAEDGTVYLKNTYETTGTIIYPVIGVPDGVYYIQIYRAPQKYTTYWSYMWGKKGIKIQLSDGEISHIASPVYEYNMTLYESNLTHSAALDYYTEPSYGIESDDAIIRDLAASLVEEGDSDYEKLRKVHDWVCNNVWYNWDGYLTGKYGSNGALAVLESKRSVCQGYANLTAALLRSLDIPTKVVSGYALGVSTGGQWTEEMVNSSQTNHAWNEAYVDGRWVVLDTTWDSDNKYENGAFSTDTGLDGYKYFDPTLYSFSNDHKIVEHEPYQSYWNRRCQQLVEDAVELVKQDMTLYYKGEKYTSKKLPVTVYNIYYVDGEYILTADKLSENLYEKVDLKVSYSSEDTSIASVSKSGTVRAKGVGTTVIKATVSIGEIERVVEVNVTVKNPALKFKQYTKSMKVGETFQFKAGLYGIKSVTWTSSKPSVATVDSDGTVTAKKAGTTYIKISGHGYEKKLKLKVTGK